MTDIKKKTKSGGTAAKGRVAKKTLKDMTAKDANKVTGGVRKAGSNPLVRYRGN